MAQKILTTLYPASPAQFEPKLVHHKGTTVHHILVYRLGQHQCSAQGHQRLLRGRPRLLPLLTGHRGLGCRGHSESCDERNQPLRGHVWLGNWDCWIDRRWGNGRSGTRAKRQGQVRVPAPTSQPFLPPNHPPSNRVTSFQVTWVSLLGWLWTPSGSDWRFTTAICTVFLVSA